MVRLRDLLNIIRESPIIAAKVHGPSKSPSVLLTPRPDSAKSDAHWLTACSEAPAQIISANSSQKTGRVSSARPFMVSVPSPSLQRGTLKNKSKLAKGTIAHTIGSQRQFSVPNRAKYAVESSTTPTCPQQ